MDDIPRAPDDPPRTPPPVPKKSVRSFWTLLGYGTIATVAATIVIFQIANRLIDPWVRARMLERGPGGSTDLVLGVFLTNLLSYPVIQFILCGLVLPAICVFRPAWVDRTGFAVITVLVLAIPTTALWYAGGGLFWIYTLPAVACALAALTFVVVVARLGLGVP